MKWWFPPDQRVSSTTLEIQSTDSGVRSPGFKSCLWCVLLGDSGSILSLFWVSSSIPLPTGLFWGINEWISITWNSAWYNVSTGSILFYCDAVSGTRWKNSMNDRFPHCSRCSGLPSTARPSLWADMLIHPNAGSFGGGGCLPQGHIPLGSQNASENLSSSRPGSFAEIQNNSKRIISASEIPWDWPRPLLQCHCPSVPVLLPLLSHSYGSWGHSPRNFLHKHLCLCYPEHPTSTLLLSLFLFFLLFADNALCLTHRPYIRF